MPFVIDASIAASWLLPDERHAVAQSAWRRIAWDQAIAPGLWRYEIRSMLIVNERRGRLDEAKANRALRLLGSLPVAIAAEGEENALLQLARRQRLTVYDAAYLELALREACPLATLDAALISAARAEGAQLIGENEP